MIDIAKGFKMNIIAYDPYPNLDHEGYTYVSLPTLLESSDIISLHCPLSKDTKYILDKNAFKKMKKNAILVNVARGPVVDEQALYTALTENMIGGAGLDVLEKEPMSVDNPLANYKDSRKLIITPHMAWASVEARTRCMQEVYKGIYSPSGKGK